MIEYTFEQFLKNYNSSKKYAYNRCGSGTCLVTANWQRGYKVEIILIDLSKEKHKVLPIYSSTRETKLEYIEKLASPCKEKIWEVEGLEDVFKLEMMRELTT